MARRLFAFLGGAPIGVFEQVGDFDATFTYEPSYSGTPLSLSIPVGEIPQVGRANHYLENLLPEDNQAQRRLARALGVQPTLFGLLSKLGEDVAGAVILSPDENLPEREPSRLYEATEEAIAYHTAILRRDPGSPPPDVPVRFSLAGQQAKFALASLEGQWFWSTAEVPSTHIFKPEFEKHQLAQVAERAMLRLATQVGIEATESEIASFAGEEVFAAKRWDRARGRRIHAEDLLQAVGDPYLDKCGVYAGIQRQVMASHGLERAHLRQTLFNAAVGNYDAHAKNYSLLLSGDQVRLAPLYDTLPIFLWPQYDRLLSLSVNRKSRLKDITRTDWVAWAGGAGYDPDLVLTEIDDLFPKVAELLPGAIREIGAGAGGIEAAEEIAGHLENAARTP